jgi:hypothetical protein
MRSGGYNTTSTQSNNHYNKNRHHHHHNHKPKREYVICGKNIANQRQVMEKIYHKLHLTHLSQFLNLQRDKFVDSGGKYLLYTLYKNNYQTLLTSIFSNFPWSSLPSFSSSLISSHSHFLSLSNQRYVCHYSTPLPSPP